MEDPVASVSVDPVLNDDPSVLEEKMASDSVVELTVVSDSVVELNVVVSGSVVCSGVVVSVTLSDSVVVSTRTAIIVTDKSSLISFQRRKQIKSVNRGLI